MKHHHAEPFHQSDLPSALRENKTSGTVRALANAEMRFSQKPKWGYDRTAKETKRGVMRCKSAVQVTSVSRNSGKTLRYLV